MRTIIITMKMAIQTKMILMELIRVEAILELPITNHQNRLQVMMIMITKTLPQMAGIIKIITMMKQAVVTLMTRVVPLLTMKMIKEATQKQRIVNQRSQLTQKNLFQKRMKMVQLH